MVHQDITSKCKTQTSYRSTNGIPDNKNHQSIHNLDKESRHRYFGTFGTRRLLKFMIAWSGQVGPHGPTLTWSNSGSSKLRAFSIRCSAIATRTLTRRLSRGQGGGDGGVR